MKNYSLITGSSSGIGKQIAIQLSKKNNLIISGTKLSELKKIASSKISDKTTQNFENLFSL